MEKLLKRLFVSIVSFFLLFSISSCGNDEEQQDGFYLVGEWTGEWQGGTVNGSAFITIEEQTGAFFRGTSFLDGNPCVTSNIILGVIDLETGETNILILDPTLSEEELQTFDPLARDTYILRENVIEITGMYVKSGHASLTYHVIEWLLCDNTTGTLEISRE